MAQPEQSDQPPLKSCVWKDCLSGAIGIGLVLQFFIAAWFTGAIFRHEQSPWLWEEYAKHVRRFGVADALLGSFLYLVFYAFIVEIACCLPTLVWWSVAVPLARDEEDRKRIVKQRVRLATLIISFMAGMGLIIHTLEPTLDQGGSQWIVVVLLLACLALLVKIAEIWE